MSGYSQQVGQIPATGTNDSAGAGAVGEYATNSISSPSNQQGNCTITIAAPAVITQAGHGFAFIGSSAAGTIVACTSGRFSTTGALPTGIVAGTNYYVVGIDANTFNVASSVANALAGTFITTTGTQSGTQSFTTQTSLTTATALDLAGFRLSAGDWDIRANIAFQPAATTSITVQLGGIGTVSNTFDPTFGRYMELSQVASVVNSTTLLGIPDYRVSLATPTNIFFYGYSAFSLSTQTATGMISARRMR